MSNEELIVLYRQGNKDALNKLIELNKGIVYKIVNRFYIDSNSIDKDDLIQEGYLGLLKAIEKYDPKYECKFSTYSFYWVYQNINRFLKQKNTNDETSLNEPVKKKDNDGDSLIDLIQADTKDFKNLEDKIYNEQLSKELDEVLKQYTTLEQQNIINLHYGLHKTKSNTLDEISSLLNIPLFKVRTAEQKAFRKIRITSWGTKKFKEIYGDSIYDNYSKVENWITKKDEEQKYRLQRKPSYIIDSDRKFIKSFLQ